MKILKLLPVSFVICSIVFITSCHQTYDSNNIPSSSTSNSKSDEIYSGTTDARNESVSGASNRDSTQNNQQMEPTNSTSASSVATH